MFQKTDFNTNLIFTYNFDILFSQYFLLIHCEHRIIEPRTSRTHLSTNCFIFNSRISRITLVLDVFHNVHTMHKHFPESDQIFFKVIKTSWLCNYSFIRLWFLLPVLSIQFEITLIRSAVWNYLNSIPQVEKKCKLISSCGTGGKVPNSITNKFFNTTTKEEFLINFLTL